MSETISNAGRSVSARMGFAAPKNDLEALAMLLMDAWGRAEPEHGVTKHPTSYVASWTDVAREIIDAGWASPVLAHHTDEVRVANDHLLAVVLPESDTPGAHEKAEVELTRLVDNGWRLVPPSASTRDRLHNNSSLQKDYDDASRKLIEVANLLPGWLDGEGEPIPGDVISSACNLLLAMRSSEVQAPRIYPTIGGGLQFEWSVYDYSLSLEISAAADLVHLHVVDTETFKSELLVLETADAAYMRIACEWILLRLERAFESGQPAVDAPPRYL